MTNKIKQYLLLTRFDKPIGIFLLLWPTLWGLWIAAHGFPQIHILIVFVLGVLLMRAAGCAINDFADREFDKQVNRTKNRPLTAEKITSKETLIIFAVLSVMAFLLVLTLNRLTVILAIIGVLLTIIYPFMKRYIHLPQLILGFAFSWSIPMAFAAQTGHIDSIAWLIMFIGVLWSIVYDTMYAMVDRVDDLKIGLKSTAILFGKFDVLMIILLQYTIVALLLLLGWKLQMNIGYFFGIIFAALFFLYQQHLIRNRNPARCFQAFSNNHWFGLLVFMGILFGIN